MTPPLSLFIRFSYLPQLAQFSTRQAILRPRTIQNKSPRYFFNPKCDIKTKASKSALPRRGLAALFAPLPAPWEPPKLILLRAESSDLGNRVISSEESCVNTLDLVADDDYPCPCLGADVHPTRLCRIISATFNFDCECFLLK